MALKLLSKNDICLYQLFPFWRRTCCNRLEYFTSAKGKRQKIMPWVTIATAAHFTSSRPKCFANADSISSRVSFSKSERVYVKKPVCAQSISNGG